MGIEGVIISENRSPGRLDVKLQLVVARFTLYLINSWQTEIVSTYVSVLYGTLSINENNPVGNSLYK